MKEKKRDLELVFARKLAVHVGVPSPESRSLLELIHAFGEVIEKLQEKSSETVKTV
jgi:hypothetical protein